MYEILEEIQLPHDMLTNCGACPTSCCTRSEAVAFLIPHSNQDSPSKSCRLKERIKKMKSYDNARVSNFVFIKIIAAKLFSFAF